MDGTQKTVYYSQSITAGFTRNSAVCLQLFMPA